MGDGTYGPGVAQTISYNFKISRTEITNSQFQQFIDDAATIPTATGPPMALLRGMQAPGRNRYIGPISFLTAQTSRWWG